MDALTVLRREHTRIVQLFAEFDGLRSCACLGRRALMNEIDLLLRRHFEMEEALVYQRFGRARDYRTILHLLDAVNATSCYDARYEQRVRALRDVLLRRFKEEETGLFPALAGCATEVA